MLDLAVAIVEHTPVSAFILLLESFNSQYRLIGSSVGPNLETLAFVSEVFEAFEPLDCRHRVSKDLQHCIDGLLFRARPLVAWFVDELGRSFSARFERRRFPVPRLEQGSKKNQIRRLSLNEARKVDIGVELIIWEKRRVVSKEKKKFSASLTATAACRPAGLGTRHGIVCSHRYERWAT